MVNLLILGETVPRYNVANYRGTDRTTPYHCDQLPDEHEANQAFFWFIQEGGELGVVNDLSKARLLVDLYRNISPPQHFEVIEVIEGDHSPENNGCFLGIDLSCAFNYSLLGWGLNFRQFNKPDDLDDRILQQISPLIALVESYFKPKLNSYGLFDSVTDAAKCLDCMMALQGIRPNLWENEESSNFKPVSIYHVY